MSDFTLTAKQVNAIKVLTSKMAKHPRYHGTMYASARALQDEALPAMGGEPGSIQVPWPDNTSLIIDREGRAKLIKN